MVENNTRLLLEVLESIKPDEIEENKILAESLKLIAALNQTFKQMKIKAQTYTGGSFAKGTTIKKEKYDVDIFAVFNANYKGEEISDLLERALKKIKVQYLRVPGSRDYFNIVYKQFRVEIIPVMEIKKAENAQNVTDVSLLHVGYVKKMIKQNKKLGNDIRIAKAFCYANNCYGAESHIKGFSGYCLEILTSFYGSFNGLIKAASKWEDKELIDPEKHYKKKDVMIELNESKLISPLILIDPVQPNRNAAAALSYEKFFNFIRLCKAFIKKPSKRFFEKQVLNEEKIIGYAQKAKLNVYLVNAKSEKKKEDISGAKLLKLFELIKKKFEKEGYLVRAEWDFKVNSAKMLFSVKTKGKIVRSGPILEMEEHTKNFKKKHKNWFVKKNRVYAEISPKTAEEILRIDKKLLEEMAIDEYLFKKWT